MRNKKTQSKLPTKEEYQKLKNILNGRTMDYHVTQKIGGHSHDRPLIVVHVDWLIPDHTEVNKLGYILVNKNTLD